eukprot:9811646-Lingulodinium_polyedra.AAC.1
MERANMLFASGCGRETSIRPHRWAAIRERCGMTRSNHRFAGAAARKPHARALHAGTENQSARAARMRAM